MLSRTLVVTEVVLCTVLLVACGGSGNTSVTCNTLSPDDCGGSISGTWALQSQCGSASVPLTGLPTACTGSALTATPATPSGTASFTSGSYNANLEVSFAVATKLSAACVSTLAPGADVATTCNDIAQASSGNGLELSCTAANGGCDCSGTAAQTLTESGTYATSGSQVTLTPTQSSSSSTSPTTTTYCARNDHLIMRAPSPFTGGTDIHLIFGKQ